MEKLLHRNGSRFLNMSNKQNIYAIYIYMYVYTYIYYIYMYIYIYIYVCMYMITQVRNENTKF